MIKPPLCQHAALIAALCLAVPAVWAGAPSFDCAKASSDVERLICSDDELAELDRSLADLYAVLLKNTPPGGQKQLKAEQRGWIKGRDDCWKSEDLRDCVANEYRLRIDELKDR